MMNSNMEQERKRRGYVSGLTPPKINSDFKRVKDYIESSIYPIIIGKTSSADKVIKTTKEFYSILFKLHPVLILPEQFRGIFKNYMDSNTKTTEGFASLLSMYAITDSPFSIPVEKEFSFQEYASLFTYNTMGLDEEKLPIINVKILMTPPTNLSPCFYASQICGTQTDRIKGTIPNYHDQFILSILIEKILAYELNEDIFSSIENYRIAELKKDIRIIEAMPNDNRIWAYYISMLKAEELFDYYVSLSNDDKKDFFRTIQRIFDGEVSLQELLSKYQVSVDSELAIPAIKRNLSLK